jgi:hypothetical protein
VQAHPAIAASAYAVDALLGVSSLAVDIRARPKRRLPIGWRPASRLSLALWLAWLWTLIFGELQVLPDHLYWGPLFAATALVPISLAIAVYNRRARLQRPRPRR